MTEPDIRRILREELAALLGAGLRRPRRVAVLSDPERDALVRFVASLAPGDVIRAAALRARWEAWARAAGEPGADMTPVAFGRAVGRLAGLRKGRGAGFRFYTVLPALL